MQNQFNFELSLKNVAETLLYSADFWRTNYRKIKPSSYHHLTIELTADIANDFLAVCFLLKTQKQPTNNKDVYEFFKTQFINELNAEIDDFESGKGEYCDCASCQDDFLDKTQELKEIIYYCNKILKLSLNKK